MQEGKLIKMKTKSGPDSVCAARPKRPLAKSGNAGLAQPIGSLPLHSPEYLAHLKRECCLSLTLVDVLRGDGVSVHVHKYTGRVTFTGHPALINWFADQIPQFRGLMSDSSTDGRQFYSVVRDGELNHKAIPSRNRIGGAASPNRKTRNCK